MQKVANETGFDPKVTLDAVFRRNVLMQPGAFALSDPPDRAALLGGVPRRFNYAEADVVVSRLARQLRALGLPDQAIVAVQLPNSVEAILTLLAVMRAGLIAMPVPMLWERSDLVTALREIAPRALITTTRLGDRRPAEVACEAAAELFTLGFPCAFGPEPPDGVIPLSLDGHAGRDSENFATRSLSPEAFAIATFDASRDGPFPVARTHGEWLAAGFVTMMAANIASGDTIVSTLPPCSLAAIAGAFVPWLMVGGTLQLSHGYSPLAATMAPAGAHLAAPAVAMPALAGGHDSERFASCIAIHRGPAHLGIDLVGLNCDAVVDMQVFGEIGFTALRRIAKIMPAPIPLGQITAPLDTPGAPIVIETRRLADGTLAVRGAMVPDRMLSINGHAAPAHLEFDIDQFVRTNLKCHASGGAVVIEAMPEGIVQIGGLRFGLDEIAMRVAKAVPGAQISFADDPLLGMRCFVETDDTERTRRALDEAGITGVIIEGIRRRPQAIRAAG